MNKMSIEDYIKMKRDDKYTLRKGKCTPCVFGCTTYFGVPMHRFPVKKTELFIRWIKSIGDTPDPLVEKIKKYKSRSVCDQHFRMDQKTSGDRLIANSIPCINLRKMTDSPYSILELEHGYCMRRLAPKQINLSQDSPSYLNVEKTNMLIDNDSSPSENIEIDETLYPIPFTEENSAESKSIENINVRAILGIFCRVCLRINVQLNKKQSDENTNLSKNICSSCIENFSMDNSEMLFKELTDQINQQLNEKAEFDYLHLKLPSSPNIDRNRLLKVHHCTLPNEIDYEILHVYNINEDRYDVVFNKKDTESRKYECTMCGEIFKGHRAYRLHIKTHPSGTPHRCIVCNKSFKDPFYLRRHRLIHADRKDYLCPVCGKAYFTPVILRAHMIYHRKKGHQCFVCGKMFYLNFTLVQHLKKFHTEHSEDGTMCEVCGRLFKDKYRLKRHKQVHDVKICSERVREVRRTLFRCTSCGECFNLRILYRKHYQEYHTDKKTYPCKLCGDVFKKRSDILSHEFAHKGNPFRRLKCKVCGKVLANRESLSIHCRNHRGEKPFSCQSCDRRFASLGERRSHYKKAHKELVVRCSFCSNMIIPGNFEKHMLIHMKSQKMHKTVLN